MKKLLLFLAIGLGIGINANSQTYIELVGKGVFDMETASLTIPDPGSVDHVVVEAAAFYDTNVTPPPGTVIFYDNNENYEVSLSPVDIDEGPHTYGVRFYYGHFITTFDDTDGTIWLDKNGEGNNVITFYAYVYRESGDIEMYTLVDNQHSFFFRNGSENAVQYEFTLEPVFGPRDLEILVPFSDNEEEAERYAYIQLIADTYSLDDYILLNGDDDNFRIENLVLNDVPGDITQVIVEIYSPANPDQGGTDDYRGDSFLVGMLLLNVEEQEYEGCALTQGYWKTHSVYGPAKKADPTWELIGPDTEFFLSGMSYIDVLKNPAKGNAYFILAHQYIAAELNFLAGADPDAVWDEFEEATSLFEAYTPEEIGALKGKNGKELRNTFIYLAGMLDKYNNGYIGPGHCGDYVDNKEKSAFINDGSILEVNDISVYPNPVSVEANITFTPARNGKATIYLYNLAGQMVKQVYHNHVKENVPVYCRFAVTDLSHGTYILQIENEMMRVHKKLNVQH